MSYSRLANKVSELAGKVSGAIDSLSSKQAFAAGLGIGVAGTGVTAGALTLYRQRQRRRYVPRPIAPSARPQPKPIPKLGSETKPKSIPGLDRAKPPRPQSIPGLGQKENPTPKPIPTLPHSSQPTRLQPATLQVKTGEGRKQTVQGGYQVTRADGVSTGLGITPIQSGDQAQWNLTHLGSGTKLAGPYDTIEQAHGLAGKLAALPFERENLTATDRREAQTIIQAYRKSI